MAKQVWPCHRRFGIKIERQSVGWEPNPNETKEGDDMHAGNDVEPLHGQQGLPKALTAILHEGVLTLVPTWSVLQEASQLAPDSGGLYAIGLPAGLRYDGGCSRIIYLGSTNKLPRRFKEHAAEPHNAVISEFQTLANGTLLVAWWVLPPLNRTWLEAVEGDAICRFESDFGTVPVCNLGVPRTPHASKCKGLVCIRQCVDVPHPIALDEIQKSFTGYRVRRKFKPFLGSSSFTANELFFMSREEYEAREKASQKRSMELKRQNQMEQLATVDEEHVADWSVDKMTRLLAICGTLVREEKSRSKSRQVVRYQSTTRQVPLPDTWGEVALVKARCLAGTWCPEQTAWVKILFKKELLGQAKLESWGFFAEDKSDLPQVENPRRSFWVTLVEQGRDHKWNERDLTVSKIEPTFRIALKKKDGGR